MDKKEKKYRNYEKTEVAIKEALIKLYKESNSIKKITVKDLCEEANISKSTFYLHYTDILNIFESVGDKFVITFKDMINDLINSKAKDFLIHINKVFDFINETSDLVKIGLTSDNPLHYYIDGLKFQLERAVVNSPYLLNYGTDKDQVLVEIKIVTSGIIDVIIELLRNQKEDQLKNYAPIINNFLNKWVMSLENTKQ